jgi:uncharacterized protein with ATP-grasp and redox domains
MRKECYYCHTQTVEKLVEKFNPTTSCTEDINHDVDVFLQHNWQMSNPLLATHIHRIIKEKINNNDLYLHEKQVANIQLLKTYDFWLQKVRQDKNPFQLAAKLAVIGNIIDYGAHTVPEDIESFIDEKLKTPLAIDHTSKLEKAITKAKSIVYLGDNAGEIVFDKLFIQLINHPNVTFAVRAEPIINDVTVDDAEQVGLSQYCKVISNGFDAPSTLLEFCSSEFVEVFNKADLIISKGQGNFEGLIDVNKKQLFFLLMAKCDTIADLLKVKKGSMVIRQQKINKHVV